MLKFCNKYKTGVWVSIMYYEPGCSDGGDWVKKGWWRLTPGQCKVAYGGDLDDLNRYFCFYADADDGAVWAGPYKRFVPFQAFAWCEWIACSHSDGSPCGFTAGFRLLDINSHDNFTVNLVP
jgi:uncharacterized membrane protein